MRTALLSFIALGLGIVIGSAALPRANAGSYAVTDPAEIFAASAQGGAVYDTGKARLEIDLDAHMAGQCKGKPVTITLLADRTDGQISCATSGSSVRISALPLFWQAREVAIVWQR